MSKDNPKHYPSAMSLVMISFISFLVLGLLFIVVGLLLGDYGQFLIDFGSFSIIGGVFFISPLLGILFGSDTHSIPTFKLLYREEEWQDRP